MIFASDLDHTLIYSKRSMGDFHRNSELIPVELHNNEYRSFMTQDTLSLLQQVMQVSTFVPVTTRTVEQYKRVFHISENLKTKYAVTSNGGNILIDGMPDPIWAKRIKVASDRCLDPAEINKLFEEISSPEWVLRGYLADGLFFTYMIDQTKIPVDIVENFRIKLASLGWSLSIQGRKLYLIPTEINKGNAVKYLKEVLSCSFVAASGDSLLDESLLMAADFAVAPSHGELFSTYKNSGAYNFTKAVGIVAAEEILKSVLDAFKLRQVTSA